MKKQNILEFLGGNKRKYHSCVISSFAFDFIYFETRLLPLLRTLNINNTIVLADGKYLEQAQEQCIGEEFKPHKGYSFHGVYSKGVFHPKIVFLAGEKDGLLLIGSGNVTSSGLNGNDEIWAAFQWNTKEENQHIALFSEVWQYLKSFERNLLGTSIQKLKWVEEFSPWVNKMPKSSGWIERKEHSSIQFVSNTSTSSSYTQLIAEIPQAEVKSIQVVSPFYDVRGNLLVNLWEHYQPQNFQCFVDPSYDSLPYQLDQKYHDKIQFYDWNESYEIAEDEKVRNTSRLHAKLLQLQLVDGTTYLYFGSANASIPAFGEKDKTAINEEAGLLIKQSDKDFIRALGINANKRKSITDYTPPSFSKLQRDNIFKSNFDFHLKYVEAKGDKISIKLDEKTAVSDCHLLVFDKYDNQLETILPLEEKGEIVFKTTYLEEIFKVQAVELSSSKSSNFALVHHSETFIRSNPQQKNNKLHQLLNGEIENYSSLDKLMSYICDHWGDIENEKKESSSIIKTNDTNKEKEVRSVSQEEFMTPSEKTLIKHFGVSSSSSNLILQFLQGVRANMHDENMDGNFEEVELKRVEEEGENDGGEEIQEIQEETVDNEKILKYNTFIISKLNKKYDHLLNDYLKKKNCYTKIEFEITEEDIRHLLIVLEVIMLVSKKESEPRPENDNKTKRIVLNGKLNQKEFGLKKFLMTTVSKFLLIANDNIVTDQDDISITRMKQFKSSLISYILFITFNMSWLPDEEKYKDNLILNTLHTLNIGGDIKSYQSIFNQLDKYLDEIKFLDRDILQEIKYFRKITLPQYIKWISSERALKELKYINPSDIIFSKKIGFYHLTNKRVNLEFDFQRVGYDFHNGDYLWKGISTGKGEDGKMVVF